MPRIVPLLALLLTVPGLIAAQSRESLVGSWDVTVPAGVRIENGESTPIFAKGLLNVSAEGDSLIGMLKVEPPAGMPTRPVARLAARLATGQVVFIQRSTATINTNGVKSEYPVTNTYTLVATGDTLSGTVSRAIEGLEGPMPTPQPISGKRVKSTG
jgi:hypothetical protein